MVYYPVPMHLQPLFGPLGYKRGDLPECERAAGKCCHFPSTRNLRTIKSNTSSTFLPTPYQISLFRKAYS